MKLNIIRPEVRNYTDEILPRIKDILESNMLSGVNIHVKRLEGQLEHLLQVNNIIAMSSCTNAMILTMQALGIRNCDVVIPSFTFSATAHMLYWNNCNPRFADIDPETFNITVETIDKVITPETKAILATHVFGNPCDLEALEEYATKKGLFLLFDGAHALGSKYQGDFVDLYGDATAYSASPTKLLSCVEGGFLSTRNKELTKILKLSRNYGNWSNYQCDLPGLNARMSELHAVIGRVQIQDLIRFIGNRNDYAIQLKEAFEHIPGVSVQKIRKGNHSTYKDFAIVINPIKAKHSRDTLAWKLKEMGIQTKMYFDPPIHKLKAYKKYHYHKLPNTEYISNNILCLPIYSTMSQEEINYLIDSIRGIML